MVLRQNVSTDTPETAGHFIYVTQVYFCAMYAVVLWDWIISLPREWRFIWKTQWTPVKLAYLFCRYWVITVVPYLLFCFVVDHSRVTCERIYKIPVGLAMWNQVGSQSVLLIRTYAFFNRNKHVLWFLLSALSGVVTYQLYVDAAQMDLLPFFRPPFVSVTLTGIWSLFPDVQTPLRTLAGFIAPLLFDTLVTLMTVWKAFYIRRKNGSPNSRLIQTFLREGIFYYILISIANLINGVFYLQPRQVISAINIPLSVMMGPVLACRLILDLRERGSETVSHSEGTGIAAFTTKSISQNQNSPFAPSERHHRKSASGNYGRQPRGLANSNIVLSTLGSIPADLDLDIEQGLADLNTQIGMDLGSLSTAIGGEDGEPLPESENCAGNLALAYHSFDTNYQNPRSLSVEDNGTVEVRIDVEKTTTTTL